MSLTYKKADPLVYGAVKKLTCITRAEKQPYQEEGFVEAPDDVICGMIKEGDSFVNPPETLDNALGNLRFKRNNLLTESDWTVLPDSPIADKTAWQTYRQELRDITKKFKSMNDILSQLVKSSSDMFIINFISFIRIF